MQPRVNKGRSLASQINAALKHSFPTSITRIYLYAIWLIVAAFLLTLFGLPELPLRTTNRGQAPMRVFE